MVAIFHLNSLLQISGLLLMIIKLAFTRHVYTLACICSSERTLDIYIYILIITWEPWVWHSLSYVSLVLMYWEVGLFRPSAALDGREPSSFSYFSTFCRTRPFCGSEGKHPQKLEFFWLHNHRTVFSLDRELVQQVWKTGFLQRDNTVI